MVLFGVSCKVLQALQNSADVSLEHLSFAALQEWARNQLATAAYKASRAADAAVAERLGDGGCTLADWGCPKCRFSYSPQQLPSSYNCFCGKQEDPEWDPWLAAHTCGELCGK